MRYVTPVAMVQLILLACFALLALAPIALVVSAVRFLASRASPRNLLIAGSFHVGFVLAALSIWWIAMPEGWTLPFWTTLQAAVDSQTYGHAVEHAAEVLAAKTIILGVLGGVLTATGMWTVTTSRSLPFRRSA